MSTGNEDQLTISPGARYYIDRVLFELPLSGLHFRQRQTTRGTFNVLYKRPFSFISRSNSNFELMYEGRKQQWPSVDTSPLIRKSKKGMVNQTTGRNVARGTAQHRTGNMLRQACRIPGTDFRYS